MGVILFILLSGKPPFEDLQHISIAKFGFEDPAWARVSEEAKDLIRRLLVVDPARRLSASNVLAHAWIKEQKMDPADFASAPGMFVAPAPVTKKAKTDKIPCRYGKGCYRKNPEHFAAYSHE